MHQYTQSEHYCNWVNTRWQCYSTHNQYIEQYNNNRTTQITAQHNNNRKTIAQNNDNYKAQHNDNYKAQHNDN